MNTRNEYRVKIARVLLMCFALQLCLPLVSFAAVETSKLLPERKIVTAAPMSTPATPATPATVSTASETDIEKKDEKKTEEAEKKTPKENEAKEKEQEKAETKKDEEKKAEEKETVKYIKSSSDHDDYDYGSSSGSSYSPTPRYGDVVQIVSSAPVETETVVNPPTVQGVTETKAQPKISGNNTETKSQNVSKPKETKAPIEKEAKDYTLTAKETSAESNVNIINPKRETTFDDIMETFGETSAAEEETDDYFSHVSKTIIIAASAFLGAVALTGLGIYLNNRRN